MSHLPSIITSEVNLKVLAPGTVKQDLTPTTGALSFMACFVEISLNLLLSINNFPEFISPRTGGFNGNDSCQEIVEAVVKMTLVRYAHECERKIAHS